MAAANDEGFWRMRFGLSAQDLQALRDEAERRARRAYDATTRSLARGGARAERALAETGAAVDRLKEGARAEMDKLVAERVKPAMAKSRDVAGKAWNAPNTVAGLAYGGVGHLAGKAMGTDPYVAVDGNAIQFRNNPFGGVGAITLGNTTTYNGDPYDPQERASWVGRDGTWIPEHERQHTIQGQQLGPLYLPSNLAGGLAALARDGDWHGPSNWNERGPQETPPRPWPRRGAR